MNRFKVNRMLKVTLIAGAASSALLGAGSAQANDDHILDACIQEFIASNLSGYQGNISVQKSAPEISSPLLVAGHRSEVVVTAAHAHGSELASAMCRVDRDGRVISLTLTSGAAKLSKALTRVVVADSH